MATKPLLKSITISKHDPHVCESVRVQVGVHDHGTEVTVNGVVGADQFVQFGTKGPHTVLVTASHGKVIETHHRKVTVKELGPEMGPWPLIWSTAYRYSPRTLTLSVANASPDFAGVSTFRWDFGDGTQGESEDPFVVHDYTAGLGRDRLTTTFQVAVEAVRAGGTTAKANRTISVFNLYAHNKLRAGVITPRVAVNPPDRSTHLIGCSFTLTNLEDEDVLFLGEQHQPLSADASADETPGAVSAIELLVPARSTVTVSRNFAPSYFTHDVFGVAIHLSGRLVSGSAPARASAYHEVKLPMKLGFAVTGPTSFGGLTSISRFMAVDGVISNEVIDAYWHRGAIARALAAPTANRVNGAGAHPKPGANGSGASRAIEPKPTAPGKSISIAPSRLADLTPVRLDEIVTSLFGQGMKPFTFGVEDIIVNQPCDPDNLPDDLPEGAVCQFTGEYAWQYIPGRILNAKKGDCLLEPGGTGVIAQLLREVHPEQFYAHCAIMTKNHVEIRHSTASEAWLRDHPAGSVLGNKGTDGLEPAALKYVWPGTITQTIDQAYYNQALTSPEGPQYWIGTFSFDPAVGIGASVAAPVVVKPPPTEETPFVRTLLHRVADAALAIDGHYRFYGYTKPEIALGPEGVAGADSGWAQGTLATVCSSFIWLAAKNAGIRLEGAAAVATPDELEPSDMKGGAAVGSQTLDGLYLYTAANRQAAANWLWQKVYDDAHDQAGFWGNLFTDAPDDVANQICNCFASDAVDDSSLETQGWKTTGDASAVSPDNMLFWDSPGPGNQQDFGGLYGHAEDIFYQPGTYSLAPVYKWKIVPTRGSVTGTVTVTEATAAGTDVALLGSGAPDFIVGSDGTFHFDQIPEGDYTLTAGLAIEGRWYSASPIVHITAGQTTNVNVTLGPPPAVNRMVTIAVHMDTTNVSLGDTDTTPWDNTQSIRVEPFHSHGHLDFNDGPGTPYGAIGFDIDLNPDLSIQVTWTAQEVDDEVESQLSQTVTIPQDHWQSFTGLTVNNPDPIDADWTTMNFTITNAQAPA